VLCECMQRRAMVPVGGRGAGLSIIVMSSAAAWPGEARGVAATLGGSARRLAVGVAGVRRV